MPYAASWHKCTISSLKNACLDASSLTRDCGRMVNDGYCGARRGAERSAACSVPLWRPTAFRPQSARFALPARGVPAPSQDSVAITQRPHRVGMASVPCPGRRDLEVGRLKHHRVARAAAAARHDAHPALNLPGVQDHILVTLPHPERAPVAAGNASRCPPAGRRRLIGRLLTRKQSRHLVLPYLSYAFSIPASSNYVKKSPGRHAWDGRRVFYSLQTNNAPAWQKITR